MTQVYNKVMMITKLLLYACMLAGIQDTSGYLVMSGLPSTSFKMCNGQDPSRRQLLEGLRGAAFSLIPASLLLRGQKAVQAFTQQENEHIKLYDKILPSVCYISTEYSNSTAGSEKDKQNIGSGIGTGFVWDNHGHIVTNFHVINKADKATVRFKFVKGDDVDYVEYIPKLTGVDPDRDIAVLKIDKIKSLPDPIQLSSNNAIKIGQYAFAIGNPFGKEFSFSMGIISGMLRDLTAPSGRKIKNVIQTDADINPGNSGGPLIDSDGKLIGMNTACMGMGVSAGVNFAVSVDMIKETVTQIIANGTVQHAALGISYVERNPSKEEAEKAGLPYVQKGVVVLNVSETSPAYEGGLRGADVIIAIDKWPINKPSDLLDILDHYKPNDKIKLSIMRNNVTPLTLEVVLGSFSSNVFSKLEREQLKP